MPRIPQRYFWDFGLGLWRSAAYDGYKLATLLTDFSSINIPAVPLVLRFTETEIKNISRGNRKIIEVKDKKQVIKIIKIQILYDSVISI